MRHLMHLVFAAENFQNNFDFYERTKVVNISYFLNSSSSSPSP